MHDCIHIYWFLEVLRNHFWSILRSWGGTLTWLWLSFVARVHSGGPLGEFLTIFGGFWVPHGRHCWVTFCYFMCFEVSKSRFGLQARFLMISDAKICWFLMSQPLKNIVNTAVFIRFHVFGFLLILMVSGTSWDLNLEVFGCLQASFWGFLRVLENHWNFIGFYGLASRLQNPAPMVSGW